MLLGASSPLGGLGVGGVERWIAYPVVISMIALGCWLFGRASGTRPA